MKSYRYYFAFGHVQREFVLNLVRINFILLKQFFSYYNIIASISNL